MAKPASVPAAVPTEGTALPWDMAAEQAVLGCAMWQGDALAVAVGIVDAGDFYKPGHGTVWEALLELAERGDPTDLVALTDELRKRRELERVGGWAYLHTIYAAPVTPASVEHYARIVARHARQRRIIETATKLAQAGWTEDPDQLRELVAGVRADLDEEVDAEPLPSSWTPVRLDEVVAGDLVAPPPTVLARVDGPCLLYPGKVHVLAGESESGKTWVALLAAAQVMDDGGDVLVLDFEDSVHGIVGRLVAMGVEPAVVAARLLYVQPDEALGPRGRAVLHPILEERDVRLAIVDGVTEAMTTHGLDPDKNVDAAVFYALLPRWLARMGPAVVLIDHVVKDPEARGRYSIGAQHKLAGLDGAQYAVSIQRPMGVGREGRALLKVAKDRPGRVRENATDSDLVAVLRLCSDSKGIVDARLEAPNTDGDGGFQPTHLMERVSRYVEAHPGMSARAIESAIRGRSQDVRLAIELLVNAGYVELRKVGMSHKHYHTRPYREGDDVDAVGAGPHQPQLPPDDLPPEPDPDDYWHRGRY